jgi:hypothetical protein
MIKELDRESREILESQLQKYREEPQSIGIKNNISTPDSARLDVDAKRTELNTLIDQYNSMITLADEVDTLIKQRSKDVQIQFDADIDITLRDSIRRVFGLDTNIVTYDMYKKCLELREQLATEDRQALKEQ